MKLEQASVLLVEDEPLLREVMGAWLGRAAGRAFCAENGAEALRILAANKIDLVVSDVRMPVMDGVALLNRINESRAGKPGMIFVTGFADLGLREAYDMGAQAILEKPIHREDLLRVMQSSLAEPAELWREPPAAAAETKLRASFPSLASALEEKKIAFGRRGFCIESAHALHEGPVEFTVEFKADRRVLSGQGMVRWTAPEDRLAGVEITHLDEASRVWVMNLVERTRPAALIPASTATAHASRFKAA